MNDKSSLIIMGAGGHGKVVAELLHTLGYDPVGFIDPDPPAPNVLDLPVLGGDCLLPSLRRSGVSAAFVALGDNALRQRIGASLRNMGFMLPTIIHPSAVISPSARIGEGVAIMPLAVVATAAFLGDLVIINSSSIVEHDGIIGNAAHIAPGCALGGNVQVGVRTLLGVGSTVRPGITIGTDAVVGAGSTVVSDVPNGAVVAGVPARALRGAART